MNAPLLSRTRVYTIEPLEDADMNTIINAALEDLERGLAAVNPTLDDEARSFLLRASNGDARSALNALEVAVDSAAEEDGTRTITVELVEQAIEKRSRYDRLGDMHYDTISAFIKSIRASDPDAAVYYLARMIDAGEDPLFIARRLVISAAEDIGLANPNGLAVAVAAHRPSVLSACPKVASRSPKQRYFSPRRRNRTLRIWRSIKLWGRFGQIAMSRCDASPERADWVDAPNWVREGLRVSARRSGAFRAGRKSA